MATTNSVTLTFGYTGTDFTRTFKIADVDDSALPSVKTKILAYNAAIPAADKKVFISDDYDASDPEDIIGEFAGIVAAKYTVDSVTNINLNV